MGFLFDLPPPPFWNRSAVLFAVGGFFSYLASMWLFQTRSAWLVVLVSAVRLLLGIGPVALIARRSGWRPAGPLYRLAAAFPYPTGLALFAYAARVRWLPFEIAVLLDGPTAFLIFVASVLLASRRITIWAVGAAVREREAERLRLLGGLLFVLTAAGVVLVPLPWSVWFLRYVPEPLALIGYSALYGHAPAQHSAQLASNS